MTKFLMIRHGVNHTIGKLFAGRMSGVDLNESGKKQAGDLAQRLCSLPISAIYTSPMDRAKQTAGPLAERLNMNTTVMEAFTELDCGEWTGRDFAELRKDAVFKRFNTFRSGTRIPGGETMFDAQVRMVNGLEELMEKHPDHTVAVVSHADPIKAAIAYFAGIPLDLSRRLEISLASVSGLELSEHDARILFVNWTGDLSETM